MSAKRCGPLPVAALLLPSCASADREITINASDVKFEPAEITVTAGEVVHVTVTTSARPHNVESEPESAAFETTLFDTDLQPGETRTVDDTFERVGSWVMYCPVGSHRRNGMEGAVAVAEVPGG